MNVSTRRAGTMLREANPVPAPLGSGGVLDGRAELDLQRITATARSVARKDRPAWAVRPLLHRPALVLAGLAVAAAAAVAVGGGALPVGGAGGTAAYAATPPPLTVLGDLSGTGLPARADARAVLLAVAARAEARPDDTGVGRYAHVEADAWSLFTRIDGAQVTSEVVPQTTMVWTAADGSGRLVSSRTGPGKERDRTDRALAPGERALMWSGVPVSSDDAVLARQLEQGHPVSNGPAERLVAVADLVSEQPLAPRVRAAVLRYLARTPGLEVDALVADRAGRRGIALHLDTAMSGLPERRTVVVDPTDGRILATESTLTESAGRLDVPVPSVISYTTYLSSRYTDQMD